MFKIFIGVIFLYTVFSYLTGYTESLKKTSATVSQTNSGDVFLSDGRKVVCDEETFNCPSPSYKKNFDKKLKTCTDVKLVYETCLKVTGEDVHDLDRDDGHPCDTDCT